MRGPVRVAPGTARARPGHVVRGEKRRGTRDVIPPGLRPSRVANPPAGVSQSLETPRLFIDPIRCEHAPDLFAVLRDPRIYTYIPEEPPRSEEDLEARIRRLVMGPERSVRELWFNWVVRTKEDGKFVGSLQSTLYVGLGSASVAYLFGPAYWGRGFAREGVSAMVSWIGARSDVRVIEALVDTRNLRSIRLLRQLGFRRIKTETRADFFKGSWSDEHLFRLSAVRPSPSQPGKVLPPRADPRPVRRS